VSRTIRIVSGNATDLPAWGLAGEPDPVRAPDWPAPLTRGWAFGDGSGEGVRVAVLDSGIEDGHPLVGQLEQAVTVERDENGELNVIPDTEGDVSGHGTACAGIIRSLAPGARLSSVRVLGAEVTGSGQVLLAGLRWALEDRIDVVNLSLSTRKPEIAVQLRELVDQAYFQRSLVVAAAHNLAVTSYPWRFASVLSVASHPEPDGQAFYVNPSPPVEFYARGVEVEIAWPGGGVITATGNSFATPHLAGLCARVLGAHPGLTPSQVHAVLSSVATNVDAA
jgi:subtilisin family serine protease